MFNQPTVRYYSFVDMFFDYLACKVVHDFPNPVLTSFMYQVASLDVPKSSPVYMERIEYLLPSVAKEVNLSKEQQLLVKQLLTEEEFAKEVATCGLRQSLFADTLLQYDFPLLDAFMDRTLWLGLVCLQGVPWISFEEALEFAKTDEATTEKIKQLYVLHQPPV